ncbi:hypothetical protein C8Q73DRAFT_690757 [Cubamyces lactineus]|nr:hypothetical protein C8Q73DRAFT_690757 [Cubamyces lactineus]
MVHYPDMKPESSPARYIRIIELDPDDWEFADESNTSPRSRNDVRWLPTGPCILDNIPQDILEEIVQVLATMPNRYLKFFSLTCKRIRRLCKPHLFQTMRLSCESKILPGKVYHDTGDVWRHIRELTIYGSWNARFLGPLVKNHGVASVLEDFLSRLSRLNTLNLIGSVAGIPSDVANMLLSISTLSRFILEVKLDCLHPTLPRGARLPTMTFTSFEYMVPRYSVSTPSFNGGASILQLVLEQRSSSLVHLTLPIGIISSSTLACLRWPRLRELNLQGDCDLGQGAPVAIDAILSGMPYLRSLSVLLPQGPNSRRLSLWPLQRDAPFPCQELESLAVSYADPQDSAYSQLPATLRRLSLRCTPRHYVRRYRFEEKTLIHLGLQSPILTASEVLSILRQCRSERLWELELEYEEDERDKELLASISAYFPALAVLTLYRYRRRDHSIDASAIEMAQALAPLKRLRILRLHLDFANAPHPLMCYMTNVQPGTWAAYDNTLTSTAGTFVAHVESLQLVCMLFRERRTNKWRPYKVVRGQPHGSSVQLDESITTLGHLNICDEDGPRTSAQYTTREELHLFEF